MNEKLVKVVKCENATVKVFTQYFNLREYETFLVCAHGINEYNKLFI